MTDLQWLAVNLLTGSIVCDLPDVDLVDPLAMTIGQYEQVKVNLHLETKTSADWLAGTQDGGGVLIAWTGEPESRVITWGGIVQQRFRDLGNTVQLGLVTGEALLEGAQVGTYNATGLNQDTILSSLMAFTAGANKVPITLNQLTPSTNVQTVAYTPSSQTSVYAALQALSAVNGGPEWTMDWVWNLAAGTILPRINYGARVGNPVNAGQQPNVTLEMNDLQAGSGFTEDYSPGHGANDIVAWGSADPAATTTDLPFAQATETDLKGRPLWTYAYQPDQTTSDPAKLATYATAALGQLQDGAQPLAMTISNTLVGKRFGVDWFLGDDLGWSLGGPDADSLAFPNTVSGTARCIGYKADTTSITPTLQGANLG